jgi:hypothetical protein
MTPCSPASHHSHYSLIVVCRFFESLWIHLSVPGGWRHYIDRWVWLQSEQRAASARSLHLPGNSIQSNRLPVLAPTLTAHISQTPLAALQQHITLSSWRLLPHHTPDASLTNTLSPYLTGKALSLHSEKNSGPMLFREITALHPADHIIRLSILNSKPHWATRQQAIAKTYQMICLLDSWCNLCICNSSFLRFSLKVLFPKATGDSEPISYSGTLLGTLLHATVYLVLDNLLKCTSTDSK